MAFGDASLTPNNRDANPSHFLAFEEDEGKKLTVWMTDEFRTSRLCCCCLEPMEGERCINEDGKAVRLFGVRRSATSDCSRTLWDRDVNAGINITRKFLWDLCGEYLPQEFRRKKDEFSVVGTIPDEEMTLLMFDDAFRFDSNFFFSESKVPFLAILAVSLLAK